MHPSKVLRFAVLPLLLALPACGGDGPSGPGGGSEFYVTAKIDGASFSAEPSQIFAVDAAESMPGMISFQGSTLSGGGRTITMYLTRLPGPGTYPLGVNIGTATGGTAIYAAGAQGWSTPLTGAAGTATITAISEAGVTGTFEFEATRDGGTGSIAVTEGRFRVPLSPGFVPATPDQLGSRMSGSIDGSPWNAATVVAVGDPATLATMGGSNDRYMVNLSLGPIAGPGSGALSTGVPVRRVTVQRIGSPGGWGGSNQDVGTLTVETLTDARITGTFSASLAPVAGATGNLELTDFEFDIRLPQ